MSYYSSPSSLSSSSSSSSSAMCGSNSPSRLQSCSSSCSPPPSPPPLHNSNGGYIQHTVTKFDTLAGVAIKYGVEVADIRKLNGLVTDRQMFGLRILQIPLPGRHSPSPCLSNGYNTPGSQSSSEWPRITPQRRTSSAMNSLQSYYGLKSRSQNSIEREILEMAIRKGCSEYTGGDGAFLGDSPASTHQPLSHGRKSRSLVMLDENSELSDYMPGIEDSGPLSDKRIRRRQKSEADFSRTPEMLLENNNNAVASGGFSATAITGKCLNLRPKSANRASDVVETRGSNSNAIPVGLGDSFIAADALSGVRKSSSTSNLQDHDTSSATSIWSASKWNLKPDLQSFAAAAISKPIFDGLPKPIVGRRNKAALD